MANTHPATFDSNWQCYPKTVRGNLGDESNIERELHLDIVSTYTLGDMDGVLDKTALSDTLKFRRDYADTYYHSRRMVRPVIEDLDSSSIYYQMYDAEETVEEWSGSVSEQFSETSGKTLLFADLRYKHFEFGGQEVKRDTSFSGSNTVPIGTSILWIGTGFIGNIFVRDVIAYEMTAAKTITTTTKDNDGKWTNVNIVTTTQPQLAYTTDGAGSGPTNDYYWGQYLVVNDTTPEPFNIKYQRNDGWTDYPMVFAPFWLYPSSVIVPGYADIFAAYYVQDGSWTINAAIMVDKRGVFFGSWAVGRDGSEFISWLIDGIIVNSLTGGGDLTELFPDFDNTLKFYPVAPV